MIFRTMIWRSGCRSILDFVSQPPMCAIFCTVCDTLSIHFIAIYPIANGGFDTVDREPSDLRRHRLDVLKTTVVMINLMIGDLSCA
jgi:hypothetical protein